MCKASTESVAAIGAWCAEQDVDAWFTRSGYLMASTAPAHDAVIDEILAVAPRSRVRELNEAGVRARCDSPRFRRGLFVADDATVQPARLALGLRVAGARGRRRRSTSARGCGRCTPHADGVVAECAGGRVRAGAAVLALNAATRGFRPLRGRVSVTSSHIVLTEPVPDVLEAIGWTGGECVTDARTFVHYFRTTRDGRIVVRLGRRPARARRAARRARRDRRRRRRRRRSRHLVEMFPALEGRAITHAWGGPIDVSPSHLPQIGTLDGAPVHYAFGFTGNGVGPSHLAGRVLAALASGEQSDLAVVDPEPARVPPEPFAFAGGMLVRRAFLRKERLEEAGRTRRSADPRRRRRAASARDSRSPLTLPRASTFSAIARLTRRSRPPAARSLRAAPHDLRLRRGWRARNSRGAEAAAEHEADGSHPGGEGRAGAGGGMDRGHGAELPTARADSG